MKNEATEDNKHHVDIFGAILSDVAWCSLHSMACEDVPAYLRWGPRSLASHCSLLLPCSQCRFSVVRLTGKT